MTTTKVFASKLTVAFVAAAMVASVFAPVAQAQTTEELQAMINDLLAQVAALQGSTGQGATNVASGICPYTWTRSLTAGSEGADVMKLQQFLNSDLDTRVSVSGAGSVGAETMYFGPATAAAVSKFQVKYRADILSPANLVNPTGYFGPSTMSKANALCATAATSTEEEGEDTDTESTDLSGEADLTNVEIDSASDDTIEEGSEDAEIATVTVEFEDGDASISRLDVSIASTSVDSWDVLDTVSLWVDGDKVAEEDASDEDNYLDEDAGTIRFSGLDIVGMEDEEVEIVIAATIQGNVDSDELTTFKVSVNALRFFDADGVATTEDSDHAIGTAGTNGTNGTADYVDFTIEEAGADDELIAKTSTNDPDATTLQVEDDAKSDWYNVFTFDLDTDDSINDIELNSISLNVATTVANYATLVDDAELVIDGTTIDDVTVTYSGLLAVLTFDVDGDVVIDAGERVEAQLMLRFKSLASGNEGATVAGSISSLTTTIVDAEGSDNLTNSQLSGAASGDAHTLRTAGVDTTMTDDSAVVTSVDGDDNDYATFEIEVEVTAFEQDVYIPTNGSTVSTVISTSTGTTSVSVTLDSSAEEVNNRFEITEGETETVTIRYTLVQAATGSNTTTGARLILGSLGFYEASTGGTLKTQTTLPATDYRTAQVDIVN